MKGASSLWPSIRGGWLLGAALALALLVTSGHAAAQTALAPNAPGTALLARARGLGIAESVAWLRLLHYQSDTWGKPASQIDGKGFFLAPSGAHDPQAELDATLRAFQSPLLPGHEDAHALCRFPARRELLDELLQFEGALHSPRCPALARYLARVDPDAVSVVYSANYLNNPASAFGHTFVRLRKRGPVGSTIPDEGLDHGVEYTANSDTQNPFLYAFKGLTGLYPGEFRFHSFASKIHEYSNSEARDLWEYDLALSSAEVTRLTLHLWELAFTSIDYYYLTKNCSYQVLATVEAAAPRLALIERLNFVVLPSDTVKALFSVPGLVRAIHYRPSLRSQFRAQVARLGAEERDLVLRLTRDPSTPLPARFTLAERVTLLDTALTVLDARYARNPDEPGNPHVERARARLMQRRVRLSSTLPPPAPAPPPTDKAPEHASGSMRLTLGTGVTTEYGSSFHTLGYRIALHDLTDPPDGEPELSQIQFIDVRLRYDLGQRSFTLDRLTFAELVALNPLTLYEKTLSWRVSAFGTRLHDRGCPNCFAHGLDLALGGTLATENEHFAVFLMADGYVAFSPHLDGIAHSFVRAGVGPYAGLRARLPAESVAVVTANWAYLPGAKLHHTYDLRATLRSALAKDVAIGLEAAVQPSSAEALFGSYLYF